MLDINNIKNSLIKDTYIEYKDITESTNDDVSLFSSSQGNKDYIVIAGQQTKGRGRLDHSFISPKGGIYLSILKNIGNVPKDKLSLITPIVALATYKAIKEILNIDTDIKWINDILYNGKKVCGVLCELQKDYKHIIIGIGIDYHIKENDIDNNLKDIVGTLSKEYDESIASRLIIALINNISSLIDKLPDAAFLDEYRAQCITIGKDISFMYNNKTHYAKALDVLNDGSLQVKEGDKVYSLNAGEVSIIR